METIRVTRRSWVTRLRFLSGYYIGGRRIGAPTEDDLSASLRSAPPLGGEARGKVREGFYGTLTVACCPLPVPSSPHLNSLGLSLAT